MSLGTFQAMETAAGEETVTLHHVRMGQLYAPLHLACTSNIPLLQAPALDCLAKLISYGFFESTSDFDLEETLSPYLQSAAAAQSSGMFGLVSSGLSKITGGGRGPPSATLGATGGSDEATIAAASAAGFEEDMFDHHGSPRQGSAGGSPALGATKEVDGGAWQTGKRTIIETVVLTICSTFTGEATDEKVQLQILKALLAAVTSNATQLHAMPLLIAIRTTYNIYLYAKSLPTQQVAQVTITQMVHAIFVKMREKWQSIAQTDINPSRVSSATTARTPSAASSNVATSQPQSPQKSALPPLALDPSEIDPATLRERDAYVRDAYNVFIALCKLSSKSLNEG